MGGELIAEYSPTAPQSSPQKEYGYRGGQMLVIASAPASPQGGNTGFESPSAGPAGQWGSFVYGPSGGSWTFTGNAGVSANGSGFTSGNPNAPEGGQVAFVQTTGQVSQQFTNWQAGVTYAVSFAAAQRGNVASQQTFRVDLDGQTLGTFTPAGTNYHPFTTIAFKKMLFDKTVC